LELGCAHHDVKGCPRPQDPLHLTQNETVEPRDVVRREDDRAVGGQAARNAREPEDPQARLHPWAEEELERTHRDRREGRGHEPPEASAASSATRCSASGVPFSSTKETMAS